MATRSLFDAYSSDVSKAADAASRRVAQLLARLGDPTGEEAYRLLRRYYPAIAQRYGRAAATRAMEYYQAERDAADPDQGYTAISAGAGETSWYEQDVEEATGRTGPGEGHGNTAPSDLTAKVARRVLERADRTVTLNARRDPTHPRWAFVAHPGACGFCVMVSSSGWIYSERGAKAQRHEHCRCTYAVDFSGDPHMDGYDPDAMRDAYARAEGAVHDDVERQWDAMSPEERARYKRKGRSAKDVYKTRRVTEEMDRRDRGWLQTGGAPKYQVLDGARPLPKEKDLADQLANDGWMSVFRPVRDDAKDPKRTSDVYFRSGKSESEGGGGYAITPVEFKQPTGDGKQTIFHQFEAAAGQARWLALDARGLGDRWDESSIESEVTRKLTRSYTVHSKEHEGDPWKFERVTVLMKDGTIRHYFA